MVIIMAALCLNEPVSRNDLISSIHQYCLCINVAASLQEKTHSEAAWRRHGLVPDHGLSVKWRSAHDSEGFSIEVWNAASADYRNH
ncbi:hypothetical protein [Acetobacter indonesiensis]|uniref:hypothetical protein n=1 Tax=Acetobacter indonesiensis TaxID=104101 RepID=UPI0039E7E696